MKIKNKYSHGKYGTFMFKLTARWTEFLVKHRWLYYLLAFTWGLPLTLLGLIISLILVIGKLFTKSIKFFKYHWIYGIKAGPDYWGGFEMGLMFVRDQESYYRLNEHEFGHTFQNCLFGPFMLLLVSIPSACRYWYQAIREKLGYANKPYDAMWFEDSASQCGTYATNFISKNE